MDDPFDLDGKTVVVTGGAGLIGSAVCEAVHERGARVVLADVDSDSGRALAAELGERTRFVRTDTTREKDVRNLVETTSEEFGDIDGLVNAAYPRNERYGRPYEDVAVSDWQENVDAHLTGCFLPTHHVTRKMVETGSGSIINFGSIYGVQAPDFTVYEGTEMTSPAEYAAVKGGILNLTQYLASYLGPSGIRVNAVSPGGVFDGQDETFVEAYERRTPLGRMADPDDIVGAVVFLLSDAASYITGHNLIVDGGWTIS